MLTMLRFIPEALAASPAAPTPLGGLPAGISQLLPIIAMMGIFYFLLIRPQQKKAKLQQKFLSELKKGDMIVTNGGIIGTIKNLSDKFVTLEIDEDVCMKILRSQVLESAASIKDAKPA